MTAYAMRGGYVLDNIDGVHIDGDPYKIATIREALAARNAADRLPAGHVVLEQADTLDGRVSQTVKDRNGQEYQRIVHADEAYSDNPEAR